MKSFKLLSFITLNIIEKSLIFLFPFFVLFISGNKALFNELEYAFSISTLLILFFDLGLTSQIFYGYKKSLQKDKFLINREITYIFLLGIYSILSIITFLIFNLSSITILILSRTIYFLISNFYYSYFRLYNTPNTFFYISIPLQLLFYLAILFTNYFGIKIDLVPIFLTFSISIFFYFLFEISKLQNFSIKKMIMNIKESFLFSYPLIINFCLIALMNHFGKIYSFNYLSTEQMFDYSILQRIATIITLVHVSVYGFLVKQIYNSKNVEEQIEIFKKYFLVIIISSIFLLISVPLINLLFNYNLSSKLLAIFIMGTVLRSLCTYFETYFNSNNQNKLLPFLTILAASIYFLIFFTFDEVNLNTIIITFFISSMINFFSIMLVLIKRKILFK